jgi:hypothetical protein
MKLRAPLALSLVLSAVLSLAALSARAEIRLPQPSPAASVKTALGVTDIVIDYHRPGVKGRKIWGALVPNGEVWRLGANEATTITFSTAVRIEGHDVPAGQYALFAVPGPDAWTLILNKEAKQWGAYDYKKDQDLLRFEVKPQAGPFTEWMTFSITPGGASAATVEMAWENLRVPFRIEADVQNLAWKGIDDTLAAKPDAGAYLAAANYALTENQRLDDALGWADKVDRPRRGLLGPRRQGAPAPEARQGRRSPDASRQGHRPGQGQGAAGLHRRAGEAQGGLEEAGLTACVSRSSTRPPCTCWRRSLSDPLIVRQIGS